MLALDVQLCLLKVVFLPSLAMEHGPSSKSSPVDDEHPRQFALGQAALKEVGTDLGHHSATEPEGRWVANSGIRRT
jgi:hypothetical protein